MENRFGFKDVVIALLLVGVIVVVVLAMVQYDRQWKIMQTLQSNAQDQTRELAGIRRALEENSSTLKDIARRGFTVNSSSNGSTTAPVAAEDFGDVFADVKAAKELPDYALGDWLIDNFGTQVHKLTPLVSQDVYSSVVGNRVQESLVTRDPNTLKYVPLLAESWDISPDGLQITFRLRKGVTFSDGHPFTADDVVYSYDLIMNPKIDAPRARAYYEKVQSVTKEDDHTVTFRFKEPYFETFGLAGEMGITPKHFYEKYTPEQFNQAPGLLMGTGPYMLRDPEAWRPGQQIELIRNERYWGEPGPFAKIVYLQVEEDAAEMTMFRNGELDVFSPPPEQFRQMSKDPEVLKTAQVFEYDSPLSGYSYIAWNEVAGGKPSRFADKRVRQAMAMLIDRDRIAQEIFLGLAYPGNGPFAKVSPQNDPNIKPIPFDVEKAKALLKEAGFEDRNGDGVIENTQGEPFKFKLTYSGRGSDTIQRMVLFLKDAYARAGIVMEPDQVDWPILQQKMDQRNYDAITLGWATSIESDIYQMFHSSQIEGGGDNFMSYRNPELDKVIEQARATVDEEERMKLWHEAHRIIADDQPYLFLIGRRAAGLWSNRIHNIKPSKLGLNYTGRLVMPIPWYVPKPMQKYTK